MERTEAVDGILDVSKRSFKIQVGEKLTIMG